MLGTALAGTVLLAGTTVHGTAALGACLAGAAGASVCAASGRLILGWFPARQRGLAMGIRQSAQPLGVAVAALVLPSNGAHGRPAALAFLGTFCLAAVVLVAAVVRDPARPPRHAQPRGSSPYRRGTSQYGPVPSGPVPSGPDRGSADQVSPEPASASPGSPGSTSTVLWRIHAASALLVVPQFAVATFRPGVPGRGAWSGARHCGRLLALAQARGPSPGLARACGPTGWAAGCARCGRWRWPPH